MKLDRDIAITWLGHSTFKILSPGRKTVLIDPWLQQNPSCPEEHKKIDRVDLMLITHGHFDHIADAVTVAKQHKPKVVGVVEICQWLGSKGVENTIGMNKGGTVNVDGINITMVQAEHTSSISDNGQILYGGEPIGFIIEFENGFKIYDAGDTNVFGDMRIIADLYRPDLVMLPIGDHYTMSPREAAYACRLLSAKLVVPIHYGTFPALTGTPAKLRELTRDIPGLEVIDLKPGETLK